MPAGRATGVAGAVGVPDRDVSGDGIAALVVAELVGAVVVVVVVEVVWVAPPPEHPATSRARTVNGAARQRTDMHPR
ncbi:hypothetical protein ADJ73_05205 [Arsenicicoccus sp. oral taxon 190]|nr:hypothetical protein ADJ73_05205 [Arsenicicoccus sp. oral taxon 190]